MTSSNDPVFIDAREVEREVCGNPECEVDSHSVSHQFGPVRVVVRVLRPSGEAFVAVYRGDRLRPVALVNGLVVSKLGLFDRLRLALGFRSPSVLEERR